MIPDAVSITCTMPKPTFIQSVLRKPTRSYADPYAPSPWSESSHPSSASDIYQPSSRYASQIDNGVHLGYRERDGPDEAGPSRRPERKAQSVMSDTQVSRGNRFPAPRKSASTLLLNEQEAIRRGETVKRKKKKPRPRTDVESIASTDGPTKPSSLGRTPTIRPPASRLEAASTSSQRSLTPPPSLKPPSERGSSLESAPVPLSPPPLAAQFPPVPPTTRPGLGVVQKAIGTSIEPPLTPPSSEWSEYSNRSRPIQSPLTQISVPPPKPAKSPKRLSVTSLDPESESENEVFYTPRSSMDLSQVEIRLPVVEEPMAHPNLPALRFQPPTPAPEPDPEDSPFHSDPPSTTSLHPVEPLTPRAVERPTITIKSPTPSPALARTSQAADIEDDAHSAVGEVGSDDEERSERLVGASRSSSFTRPRPVSVAGSRTPSTSNSGGRKSKPTSRSPSVILSNVERPSSRASTSRHAVRNSFDDFVVRRNSTTLSEMSYAREGSVRSGTSGLGKGGWAAAAASRSGAASPVMYMPAGGNDGWAQFQPPPRQSRFTPLPAASQPASFHTIVHGRTPTSSVPSSYSQDSDEEEDDLPQASRSYARQDYVSESGYSETRSQTSNQMDDRYLGSLRQRQASLGSSVDPYAVPRPPSSAGQVSSMTARDLRQSFSPTSPSGLAPYDSRPTSPIPSRPSSRIGFEPPSFLNPDTLTVLPEMTQEDSARTYAPSEPARPPRRAPSIFGGRSRGARSEVDYDDERDDVPELPRRAKSALGHREDLSRWEGSSAGEGVLMESHGRGSEHVTGYRYVRNHLCNRELTRSTLVMPNGAYRPVASPTSNSAKTLDHRVLGMPHATMAAIVLSTLPARDTPLHLKDQNPPIDFTSHLRPPNKIGSSQILVQVYATAIDETDVRALDDKGRAEIGKWVPGRSFVGRCMTAGADEKEIVRGEIVIGIMDVRKVSSSWSLRAIDFA